MLIGIYAVFRLNMVCVIRKTSLEEINVLATTLFPMKTCIMEHNLNPGPAEPGCTMPLQTDPEQLASTEAN